MDQPRNPLSKLNRKELIWLFGILEDACRERLEKNLVSQVFEEQISRRGLVEGRMDPRPFLKIWEPRYRKFLDVATELHALLQADDALDFAATLRTRFDRPAESGGRRAARSRPTAKR
jgi:hypothetical protein